MAHKTFDDAEDIRVCRGDIDYRGIVAQINDGVAIIREGKIVFANHAFFEITRRDPGEVIGSDFSDYPSPCDRERVTKYCTERLYTESLSDTIEFLIPRGTKEAVIEMKVSVVECGGAPAILGALTDITERRKTRIELNRIKERLESILHSMNEVVVSMTPDDYRILSMNPAAEALYGIPLRDFTSGEAHIMNFVHPVDLEKVKDFYANLPEAEFGEAQYRIVSSDKRVKWVLDEGHVVYSQKGVVRRIDHVIRDITEEKKTVDALRQSEAKYRDFFDSTSDMAFTLTPQGDFVDINEAGVKLLGFDGKKEALASNIRDFYADVSERAGLLDEIYGKGHVEGRHVTFRNKEGKGIQVAVTARAKIDDSGRFLYHEGIAHNISQALEDQRNRVLRNAAGSMCHYLNTHLMNLLGSKDAVRELMTSLDQAIGELALGEPSREIAARMKTDMEEMHYFFEGISKSYERIAEVTHAFNKAFRYEEESYVSSTILDIFRTYGYEGEDSE